MKISNNPKQKVLQGTSVLPAAYINSLSPFPVLRVLNFNLVSLIHNI